MKRIGAGLAALLLVSAEAGAQTLQDVERSEAALVAVWDKTPLTSRRVLFVSERPKLYGQYVERPNNVFKPGEALLTYVEPIGYTWTPAGADGFRFGVTLDFLIKSKSGEILGGREKFLNYSQTSRYKVRELMVNISLNMSGAPAGEYVVEYIMHDDGSGKIARFQQPFRIAE